MREALGPVAGCPLKAAQGNFSHIPTMAKSVDAWWDGGRSCRSRLHHGGTMDSPGVRGTTSEDRCQ